MTKNPVPNPTAMINVSKRPPRNLKKGTFMSHSQVEFDSTLSHLLCMMCTNIMEMVQP